VSRAFNDAWRCGKLEPLRALAALPGERLEASGTAGKQRRASTSTVCIVRIQPYGGHELQPRDTLLTLPAASTGLALVPVLCSSSSLYSQGNHMPGMRGLRPLDQTGAGWRTLPNGARMAEERWPSLSAAKGQEAGRRRHIKPIPSPVSPDAPQSIAAAGTRKKLQRFAMAASFTDPNRRRRGCL